MKKLLTSLLCCLSLSACNLDKMQEDLQQLQKAKEQLAEFYVYLKEAKESLKYAEFWITVHKLEATDQQGQNHVLFEQEGGKSINLISRDGLSELLALGQLPLGDYQSLSLTVGRDIYIITPEQQQINTHFPTDEPTVTLLINTQLSISGEEIVNLIINFDPDAVIAKLEQGLEPYREDIQVVIDELQQSELYQQISAELEGSIIDIKGSTFWIETASGVKLKVVVPGFASLYNEHRRKSVNLQALHRGQWVRIFGKLHCEDGEKVLEALTLALETLESQEDVTEAQRQAKVKGVITALGDNSLTLDLQKASFLPSGDTIELQFADAMFIRGSRDMLSVGAEIEARGQWDGTTLQARFIRLEGAPDTETLQQTGQSDQPLSEIKGSVVSVDREQATIVVEPQGDGQGETEQPVATPITVDLSNAWIKNGDHSCLQPGVNLELHGLPSQTADQINASSVELEDPACQTPAEAELPEPPLARP